MPQPPELDEQIDAFRSAPGLHTAGDLVGTAFAWGMRDDAIDSAAEFILSETEDGEIAHQIADRYCNGLNSNRDEIDPELVPVDRMRVRVSRMRSIVRKEPRNAVRWADLALAHVNLGEFAPASREISNALALAPRNRHILRAASRFFLLRDEPDRAHHVLVRHPEVLSDPWVLAAELAASELAGQTSRYLRRAKNVVESQAFAPRHISELASELATAELRAGQARHGRRHMRAALVDPTENALAQAEWAAVSLSVEPPPRDEVPEPPRPFEARALAAAHDKNFDYALHNARLWQADQSFDPRPGTFASFWASVGMEDFKFAAEAARTALVANPDNAVLRNNLIFALANSGRLGDALKEFMDLKHPEERPERATITATAGLLLFRQGDIDQGRKYYTRAIEAFRAIGDPERIALVSMNWAREELMARTPEAESAFAQAASAAEKAHSVEVAVSYERLLSVRP